MEQVEALAQPFIDDLAESNIVPQEIKAQIKRQVSWDITFICLECEFSDLIKPFLYIPFIDPWYAAGHFPCGWEGTPFPIGWDGIVRDGRLMVF